MHDGVIGLSEFPVGKSECLFLLTSLCCLFITNNGHSTPQTPSKYEAAIKNRLMDYHRTELLCALTPQISNLPVFPHSHLIWNFLWITKLNCIYPLFCITQNCSLNLVCAKYWKPTKHDSKRTLVSSNKWTRGRTQAGHVGSPST